MEPHAMSGEWNACLQKGRNGRLLCRADALPIVYAGAGAGAGREIAAVYCGERIALRSAVATASSAGGMGDAVRNRVKEKSRSFSAFEPVTGSLDSPV